MHSDAKVVRRSNARKMSALVHLKRVPLLAAVFAAVAISTAAQQSAPTASPTDDLQKQLAQLKQQYEATTRDLEQRIASLEQQIQTQQEKEKEAKEKEEKEASEKKKQGAISAAELAAQQYRLALQSLGGRDACGDARRRGGAQRQRGRAG